MLSSTGLLTPSDGAGPMCAISCSAIFFCFDIIPQLDYVALVDSEEAFTAFANACAQAGAAKCLPVGMIQGNVTGSDVHLLFISTIDVSSGTLVCSVRGG